MISAKLSFAAEGIVRDAASDSISVFSLVEGIQPMGFPFFIPKLSFFALWERTTDDPEDIDGNVVFRNNDKVLFEKATSVHFRGTLRHRTIINIGGMVINEPGALIIEFRLENGAVANYTILIEPSLQVKEADPAMVRG